MSWLVWLGLFVLMFTLLYLRDRRQWRRSMLQLKKEADAKR